MRLPAYLLLPLLGTVLLGAVVLGAWLWPEPTVPAPNLPLPAPAAVAPPAPPPPAFKPAPPRPVVGSEPARPPQPVEPPPSTVASPAEPPVALPPPPPPGPEVPIVATELPPEQEAEVKQVWLSLRERAAEKALEEVQELERQRDEARARGDQTESERLDQLITTRREGVEELRGLRPPKVPPRTRISPTAPPEQPPR